MCFSNNRQDALPPWKKPKLNTELCPERMHKGISREDYTNMEVANA